MARSQRILRRRYAALIRVLKMVLPAIAVLLTILIVAWPELSRDAKSFRVNLIGGAVPAGEGMSIVNARFTGVDDENQPFTVVAEVADQSAIDENLLHLRLPKADITLNDGSFIALNADAGLYDTEVRQLQLMGSVNLSQTGGLVVTTNSAEIDLDLGTARGGDPVEAENSSGTLVSQGFRVMDRGQRVLFTGKSRLVIQPDRQGDSP